MINQNLWLSLTKATRDKLKELFLVPKTGLVEVVTDSFGHSQIKADGHTFADLQVITVEKMQDYLGSIPANETPEELFRKVVIKVETPEAVTPEVLEVIAEAIKPMNTADTPLQCDQCPYTTGNKRGLNMHKNIKHKKAKVI